jgi:hypothetical protein
LHPLLPLARRPQSKSCEGQTTRQPIEGDVVDADKEFSELCTRMRETGRTSCTILFCESDVYVEADPHSGEPGIGVRRSA